MNVVMDNMGKNIDDALAKLTHRNLLFDDDHTKCDDKKALEYLKMLKKEKRYLLDVY